MTNDLAALAEVYLPAYMDCYLLAATDYDGSPVELAKNKAEAERVGWPTIRALAVKYFTEKWTVLL